MPNWCENTIQIYGSDIAISWIRENLNCYCGRRWEDASMRKEVFMRENEKWSFLYISVSTTGTDILDFVNEFLRKYKDIHVQWYYYIEGGFGAAYMDLGTDEKGNPYEICTRIDIEEPEEEEDYSIEEQFFDECRGENPDTFILAEMLGFHVKNFDEIESFRSCCELTLEQYKAIMKID